MFTIATQTVGLLGSCAKINERLDDLEKKVGGLENEEIATIESQVESIESSISDLKSIRDKVQAMSDPATGLSKRIEDLEAFASDVKKNYATQDWAKTTLVTMDEYEKTCDTVAKIAAKVEGFDSNIKACADSLKGWVNEKFGGYYDIATIDAKLAELQEQVDGVDSLSAELAKTRTEIDTAKAAIRAEYRAAITSAIETSEGKLTQALRDSIDSVNATIGTLTDRVDILETKVDALKGRVDSLENMIQTVTIVPAYSDGSVILKGGNLYIDCIVTPRIATKTLAKDRFTILLNKVITKAVVHDTIKGSGIKDENFEIDTAKGAVSIKAFVGDKLPGNDTSLAVALNVKNSISNYTTGFVTAKLFIPDGALNGGFSVSASRQVRFSKGNLKYSKGTDWSDGTWGFFDNQYDCDPGTGNKPAEGYISLFSWGYDATKSIKPDVTSTNNSTVTTDGASFLYSEDWGSQVSPADTWRTLTNAEWKYIFNTRDVSHRFAKAKVKNVSGVLIFPDVFVWESSMGTEPDYNAEDAGFDANAYEDANFVAMQNAGVVFLPATGYRGGGNLSGVGGCVNYWSSTACDEYIAYFLNDVTPGYGSSRNSGYAVRLVTDVK